jgi:DNA (cytosine-5)-methyltransferase 1
MRLIWWFTKAKRAQTSEDFETWVAGGVAPTLNAFDCGDTRATVLIIDGTRVGDVRWREDCVMQTVIQRWGTGGGNVPLIYPIDDGREVEKHQNGTGIGNEGDPAYTLDRQQAPAVALPTSATVRRLTPTECERLQGFPDGWTDEQADSHRYKQMGNAVAVPVVQWIINRLS